ncbi:phosphate-selective porin OprO/OprP [Luteibacter jiangsuensis]|uniref:Phosphate-selective porin OprO/OprP n=1 Tax=Luteibacter jiangsuensis TaxID=637577 RepID=A0ABT9SYX1_9GAMM|nr:porin [Luteibacter jiangsuensis]MDQ0009177.1 phosphate-selective porin OprO/OprP [Luteibacter jiangsuensis]
MKKFILGAVALIDPVLAEAADAVRNDYDGRTNWPTHYVFADGTDMGLSVKYQYDLDRFSHDEGTYEDAQTNRRKEFGFFVRKKGVYDATAVFDFQTKTWLDVFFRLQSKALMGSDAGALRIGFMKTPVGFEGNTSTGSTSFMETSLPMQAIYANRRLGIDWALTRKAYLVQMGYYNGGNLQGDLDGHMVAGRAAWTPLNASGNVLHIGGSLSRETPYGTNDGRGRYTPPGVRLRALPEAGLATRRLIDSGALSMAGHVDRRGLEALWIGGPWSVQSEYLDARVKLENKPAYKAHGWYAFGSWVATGESRSYSAGNVSDVVPKGRWGALEFVLRYSTLDLDDGPTLGGTEHDWTFGANWYLTKYLKLQGNYVRAISDRRDVRVDPRIVELRAQVMF